MSDHVTRYTYIESPVGILMLAGDPEGLSDIRFMEGRHPATGDAGDGQGREVGAGGSRAAIRTVRERVELVLDAGRRSVVERLVGGPAEHRGERSYP